MSDSGHTEEIRIKALLGAWADAVRRHDVPAILAHHTVDGEWRIAHEHHSMPATD